MHNVQSKEERTTVTMAYFVGDEEREIFAPATADLETGGKKFELQVEGSYKRNKAHVETNPDKAKEVFYCTDCTESFTGRNQFKTHLARHLEAMEDLMYCAVCTKRFTGRDQWKNHVVKHSEATGFMCDDCDEECQRKGKLR